VLAECERLGLAFIPYFPLASGLLTGKYRRGQPAPAGTRLAAGGRFAGLLSERNLALVEALTEFAGARGHVLLELAISWLLSRPAVASVIAGVTSPEQVAMNASAAGWRLTPADLAEVDAVLARTG
jgi:aryl-alcohol dehydrogenase-like predicted oxidoreductase